MKISDIFREYKRGSTPDNSIMTDDEKVAVAVSRLGNSALYAQNIRDDRYLVARIEPVSESDNEKFRRQAKSPVPNANPSNQFKYCKFQFLEVNIPKYVGDDFVNDVKVLTNSCSRMWNSPQATRLKTARSERSIQRQWDERYLREKEEE